MIKKWRLLLAAMLLIGVGYGQSYTLSDDSSTVSFTIKNAGIRVGGRFTGLKGNVVFDTAQLAHAAFDVVVDAASVNTGNQKRDEHLRKEDFFNCQIYPLIHFVSTKVTKGSGSGTFFMTGTLTIRDISKTISWPFTVIPTSDGYRMEGSFRIRRKDFNVGKASTISDRLTVSLNVLAKKGS